jgi:uncharacterized protein YjbI with pentapeptide repeats
MTPLFSRALLVPIAENSFETVDRATKERIKNQIFVDRKFGYFELENQEIRGSRWQNCHWQSIQCTKVTFSGVEWLGGVMMNVCFRDCHFSNCQFLYLDLSPVKFENCHFEHCYFFDRNLQGCQFHGCSFFDIDMTFAQLTHADLSETRWERCCFEGANLSFSNLRGAQIIDTRWRGIQLEQTQVEGLECLKDLRKA